MSDENLKSGNPPPIGEPETDARNDGPSNPDPGPAAGARSTGATDREPEAQSKAADEKASIEDGEIIDPSAKPGDQSKAKATKGSFEQEIRSSLGLNRQAASNASGRGAQFSLRYADVDLKNEVADNFVGRDMHVTINHRSAHVAGEDRGGKRATVIDLDVTMQRIAENIYGTDIAIWANQFLNDRIICLDIASSEVSRYLVHALCSRLNLEKPRIMFIDGQAIDHDLLGVLHKNELNAPSLIYIYDVTVEFSDLGRHAKRDELIKHLKDRVQYLLISCASLDDGGPAAAWKGAVGPGDGLAFLISRYCSGIAEPAVTARQIVARHADLAAQGEFRRFSMLERAIQSLAGLSGSELTERFAARLLEIRGQSAGAPTPSEPSSAGDGDQLLQRSVLDSLRFVALHFKELELPEFLLTVHSVLAWLDTMDPIEIVRPANAKSPAAETGSEAKGEAAGATVTEGRSRRRALDRDTDYFLAKAALAVRPLEGGAAVVDVREPLERERMSSEFAAKPLVTMRFFQALSALASESLSFRWHWHRQMCVLSAAMALRSPAETSRQLLGDAGNLENVGTFVQWQWVVVGLLNSQHPGAMELLGRLGSGLMARSESRKFAFEFITLLDHTPHREQFRDLGWLGLLVDALSPDDELVAGVADHLEACARSAADGDAAYAIETAVDWYEEGDPGPATGMRSLVAHRFLTAGLANLIVEWLTAEPPRNPFDFPLFRLLSDKGGPELVERTIAAWPVEDPAKPLGTDKGDAVQAANYLAYLVVLAGRSAKRENAKNAGPIVQALAHATKQRFAAKRPQDFRALSAFKRSLTECEREFIGPAARYDPAMQRQMHQLFAQFRMHL